MWIGSFNLDVEGLVFKVLVGGNELLLYVAAAWLVLCYLGMIMNTISVLKGNEFKFPLIEGLVLKFRRLAFG